MKTVPHLGLPFGILRRDLVRQKLTWSKRNLQLVRLRAFITIWGRTNSQSSTISARWSSAGASCLFAPDDHVIVGLD